MNKPLLSILIPTVPERFEQVKILIAKLEFQCAKNEVEILYLGDNRQRSIGAKRNDLLQLARGQFVAFVDDDDDISNDYCTRLCDVIRKDGAAVDVISFLQIAKWNDQKSLVQFGINNEIFGAWQDSGVTQRFPWHSCAWRAEIAKQAVFSEKNWGEDSDWVQQVYHLARREAHVDEVLHFYTHTDERSLAIDKPLKV